MVTDRLRQLGREVLRRIAPGWRARTLPGILGRVHRNDAMLYDESPDSIALYLRAANSAVEIIEIVLERTGREFADIECCLDFGCGHGRVLRLLQLWIPPHKITACDVDAECVWFCASEFGARPLLSHWQIDQVRFETYDLIWSGSVFTHLDARGCEDLFAKLTGSLMAGGILIFSIHGGFSLGGLEHFYGAGYAAEAEQIRHEVAQQGLSFRAYDESFGHFPGPYGMTWHEREYFERLAAKLSGDLQLIHWQARGWDEHHDVLAFQRTR